MKMVNLEFYNNLNIKQGNKIIAQKYIHAQVKRLWRDSAKEFVKAVLAILSHHVDTGMSMASLVPLATDVKFKTLIQELMFGSHTGGVYYDFGGVKTNLLKSPELGEQKGKSAYELSFGTPAFPEMVFNFRIVVYHYYLHELGIATSSTGAWATLSHGKAAFLEYFQTNLKQYVQPKKITQILLRGGIR